MEDKESQKRLKELTKMAKKLSKRFPKRKNTGSDFGKGLVYNLALFAGHFGNDMFQHARQFSWLMNMPKAEREKVMSPNPDPKHNYGKDMEYVIWRYKKFAEIYKTPEEDLNSQITLWANGASDHLYEIQVPEKWKGTKLGNKILKLQKDGLDMGHGRGLMGDKTYKIEDLWNLVKLTNEIGRMIDKELGVESTKAVYE